MTRPITEVAADVLAADQQATPGPWRFGALERGGRHVTDRSGYLFAQVDDDGNGRLIAAYRSDAPEMARALIDIAAILDSDVDVIEGIAALRRRLGLPEVP